MAKGDNIRARNKINEQGGLAQNNLNNLRTDMVIPQAQQMWNNYQNAADLGFRDYGNLMSGFQDFQRTGGYNPTQLGQIRNRANSPIRSVYANANREVDRGKVLSGYSPNFNATKAKMAREMSYALGDNSTNTEAQLAQMVNQGRQYGYSGGANLYGTAPGMAGAFGNQALGASRNWLDAQQLQNQLSLGIMGAQNQAAQLPGRGQSTLNGILGASQIAGNIGGAISGFGSLGGGNPFSNPAQSIGPMDY